MKRLLVILICCTLAVWTHGQTNVTALEYFVDNDPGVGMATPIPITPSTTVDITFTVPTTSLGLANGLHLLVIRAQDSDDNWGVVEKRNFFIQADPVAGPTAEDVVAMEYFIDDDPGVGMADAISISSGQDVTLEELIPASTLGSGLHVIGLRARNNANRWSFVEKKHFYVQEGPGPDPTISFIDRLEYFFNEDPGPGSGTEISISSGTSVDLEEAIDMSSLDEGYHTMVIRARNTDNEWSFVEKRLVYIQPAPGGAGSLSLITALEYFFDEDPGLGMGTQIPITPSTDLVDINNIIFETGGTLSIGDHTVTVRAQNALGQWGYTETRDFSVDGDCPLVDFTFATACEGQEVALTDISTGILGSAEYKWYSDEELISELETGVSHVFETPGTHTLSLVVSNGMVCSDSIGYELEIKPEPVVIFFTDEVTVGNPTNFDVEQFDVSPEFTWSWDFDGDGMEDDNTAGDVAFQFPAAGTYTSSITVSDAAGCDASFARNVTVNDLIPIVSFEANNVCLGDAVNFQDLSENVAIDATYSWDFDGDGVEDSGVIGSTNFSYPAAGTFTATLTITLAGGDTFDESQTVTVGEVPTADFSFDLACEGEGISILDLSSGLSGAATYSWYADDELVSSDASFDSYIFESPGTHTLALAVQNDEACTDSIGYVLEIKAQPVLAFFAEEVTIGNSTLFEVESQNVTGDFSWSWDFDGDGVKDDNTAGDVSFQYPISGSYTASLTVSDALGCDATFSRSVEVNAIDPTVSFQADNACLGELITFEDFSQDVPSDATYSWDFDGDGIEDSNTAGSTSFSYGTAGTYSATLTITLVGGEVFVDTKIITIGALPTADFSFDLACEGEAISIQDLSSDQSGMATYSWYANDLLISTEASFNSYVFDSPGAHTLSLAVQNDGACSDSTGYVLDIKAQPVVVFFAEDVTIGETTQFDVEPVNVTSDFTWAWDFDGDGTEDDNTVGDVSFQYAAAGTYTASLTVDDAAGCDATFTRSVTVNELTTLPDPIVSFTAENVCLGEAVNFVDLSENVPSDATYSWDYDGDGIEDSNVIGSSNFLYPASGTYQATLTITLSGGDSFNGTRNVVVGNIPTADFDLDLACEGESISIQNLSTGVSSMAAYRWYANDLLVSTDPAFNGYIFESPGVHTLALAIENDEACTDSIGYSIEIKPSPAVAFYVVDAVVGETTEFIVNDSNLDNDFSWEWDFDNDGIVDDNTTGSTSFTYTSSGLFDASLSVSDGEGCDALFVEQIDVAEPINPDDLLMARFKTNDVCLGETVAFADESQNVPDDATYSWDFEGDGMEDATTVGDVSFDFEEAGTYLSKLTITTSEGEAYTFSYSVIVAASPQARFSSSSFCGNEVTTFEDLSTSGDNSMYQWDFDGDGVIDSQTAGDQSFTYQAAGSYSASLLVENEIGCIDVFVLAVEIETAPTADFTFDYQTSGGTAFVNFVSNTTNTDEYLWDFGNGNTSELANPSFDFDGFIGETFTVCLTASNVCESITSCQELSFLITGTQSLEDAGILIYPNPSVGYFNLDFSRTDPSMYQVRVLDLTGKLVKQINYNALKQTDGILEISNLNSGSYLVQVDNQKFEAQQTIIVR